MPTLQGCRQFYDGHERCGTKAKVSEVRTRKRGVVDCGCGRLVMVLGGIECLLVDQSGLGTNGSNDVPFECDVPCERAYVRSDRLGMEKSLAHDG